MYDAKLNVAPKMKISLTNFKKEFLLTLGNNKPHKTVKVLPKIVIVKIIKKVV